MDRLEANAVCIVATLTTMLMAGTIPNVSADCTDPGQPKNGNRIVTRKSSGFPMGTVISFSCNTNYTLVGAKKIICEVKDNKYSWNGKLPSCKWLSGDCPFPPPTVPHANIDKTKQVGYKKGGKAYYRCVDGYTSEQAEPYKLCDKDPRTQGFIWSGNFTCKKKTCGNPPAQSLGDGTYSLSVLGSSTVATYHCSPTFLLKVKVPSKPATLVYNYSISCNQTGYWSRVALTCVKTCRSLSEPKHGYIFSKTGLLGFAYTQGVKVTFACHTYYRLVGSSSRTCLPSGYWSNLAPHCVRSACANPGDILHGRARFNSTLSNPSIQPIWTTVTYSCLPGYQRIGDETRQCLPNGHWSGKSNTTCEKSYVTCGSPRKIPHGQYKHVKPPYKVNVRVEYICEPKYFRWGAALFQCTALPGNLKGYWREVCDDQFSDYSCRVGGSTQCLPLDKYGEKCKESGGHVPRNSGIVCVKGTDATPADNLVSFKSGDNELDKMTIVVATAGSTLGALVVLLTALVCFRRFHRSRRFRHSAFRSRRYSDDDRIAIIAAYTGDVHFILPSYDEAMSQVQSSPPSFESVVENRQEGGNQIASNANSQSVDTNERNIAANGTDGASEVSRPAASVPEGGPSTGEERLINIVNNPLADSSRESSETTGINHSDNVLLPVEDRMADHDSSPNLSSESLPSSSSEDDLTSSQTQPLLGNRARGVMV
ncbi:complement component receptor 1-like protein [Porites lutea]|uniref:complement component receptor 1-like protein n=1 Tax=Porites lutea TaxID=51062 RepID=UPI003CC53E2B